MKRLGRVIVLMVFAFFPVLCSGLLNAEEKVLKKITDFYNPIWDTTRKDLADCLYEDDSVILASNFECGNGFHFRKTKGAHYVVDIQPEPGNHIFSGKGFYFCFAALNKKDTPERIVLEVRRPNGSILATKFVIVKHGSQWSHLPKNQMRPEGAFFEAELPPRSDTQPVRYFSNYHWYPYTEMAAYVKELASQRQGVRLRSIGKSVKGRDLWAVEVGREGKDVPTIVCAASSQAGEMGGHCCRAVIDFLLSNDADARQILSRHRVCLVPDTNPDGTVMGHGNSDAAGKFPNFCGGKTIAGDPDAPVEQVALWKYLKGKRPWIYIEWHSNHWDYRKGHWVIWFDPSLATDTTVRRVWDAFDKRLILLPNKKHDPRGRGNRTNFKYHLALGVATELGGIPIILKVHDKYPYQQTMAWVVTAFRAATDAYEEGTKQK